LVTAVKDFGRSNTEIDLNLTVFPSGERDKVWWGWRARRESEEEVEVLWCGRCMIKSNTISRSNP
jgi:hypothetical protein